MLSSDLEQQVSSPCSWQKQLTSGFKTPEELLDYLNIAPDCSDVSQTAHLSFRTRVPRAFANKMKQGDLHDPLLKQVLPIHDEMINITGYVLDPLEENQHNPVEGLLHKYGSRVLLTLTAGCAINCRYCFRRHFDYKKNTPGSSGLSAMLNYIRHNKEIKEVILSGGDPLLLPDDRLEEIIFAISSISSVEILRIHTRMPIVIPERITPELISMLQKTRLQTICVVHANHPNEFDIHLDERLLALRNAGTHVLNQSVLLKGINDHPDILCQLSYRLLQAGVIPYYLHLLDKVQGAAHFDISTEKAIEIHEEMRKKLPGYLLPRLVREVPNELSKMPVSLFTCI
jgi:L-lysine 2,3-aminomutase